MNHRLSTICKIIESLNLECVFVPGGRMEDDMIEFPQSDSKGREVSIQLSNAWSSASYVELEFWDAAKGIMESFSIKGFYEVEEHLRKAYAL